MVTAATTLAPPHPDAWVGVDADCDTVALAIVEDRVMTWLMRGGTWRRALGADTILVAWGKAMAARADAERALRLVQLRHAYVAGDGTNAIRVARHADVIDAENALLAAGGKP